MKPKPRLSPLNTRKTSLDVTREREDGPTPMLDRPFVPFAENYRELPAKIEADDEL